MSRPASADVASEMSSRPRWGRIWRVGFLVVVGIIGLPTVGLVATNHLLRQTDERRARQTNTLAATAVAYTVAQSYQQRVLVLRDLPSRPGVAEGLSERNRTVLQQSLDMALKDGQFCRLVLRSPGIDPLVASAPGSCWSPPATDAGQNGLSPLGVGIVGSSAFTGLNLRSAVPGDPAATFQAVFAANSLTTTAIPGAGTHVSVVDGTTILSSTSPALVGKPLITPAATAMVRAGRPASATVYSPRSHTDVVLAFQPVPGTGLGVFFSVTTKVAYAPANHVSRLLFYGYLALVLIGLGLAALVVIMLRRREQARDAATRHYRSLAEATPDGVAIVDEEGRLVYANPALTAMVGLNEHDSWRGHSTGEWTGLTDEETTRWGTQTVDGREAPRGLKMHLRHADGHRVPVEVNTAPFDVGSRPGTISVIRDLTQSRATEVSLALAETRQRTTIESASEGIILYDLDDDRRPIPVLTNPAAAAILGDPLDETQQRWRNWTGAGLVDADGAEIDRADLPVNVVARTGHSVIEAVFGVVDSEHNRRWLRVSANPVCDRRETMVGIVTALVDITGEREARDRAETEQARFAALAAAAARESEERLRLAFEHAPIGKALVGLDGRYKQVNQAMCNITGYSEADLLQMTIADTTHPDDLTADTAAMDKLLAE